MTHETDIDIPPTHSVLTLGRKPTQTLVIGQGDEAVYITVVRSRGDRGSATDLRVVAPRHTKVDRLEIRRAKEAGAHAENQA
ncbi:MAG: carbon storage regulator [Gammaproteobacteria bacterium]|nr:carbon storage regulator [Gammaproteobacteria bacterium]MCP5135387.1 carbon storage regulator [Gammaproteobacteria bacterium]